MLQYLDFPTIYPGFVTALIEPAINVPWIRGEAAFLQEKGGLTAASLRIQGGLTEHSVILVSCPCSILKHHR